MAVYTKYIRVLALFVIIFTTKFKLVRYNYPMDYRKTLSDINTQKILKYYRRYRIVRWLLLNPIFRALAFVVGGFVLIVIWPFALMYMVYRTIRFSRQIRNRQQRSTKHRDIIDL